MSKDTKPISREKFIEELLRYRKGSVSRRHFLGVTGLGLATAVLGSAMPGLRPRPAYAAGELGDTLNFTTWPNYFAQANLDQFTKDTGVNINVAVFGSNEEMLAKLQAGGTGWDVFVPTNYTISTYQSLDLIEPLDLAQVPNFDESTQEARFIGEAKIGGTDLRGAEELGNHRLRRQHRQGEGRDDQLAPFLGPHPRRPLGPGDGARLPADDHRQRAEIFRLFVQFGRSERTGRGREAADRSQAASVRHQLGLPARHARGRCLAVGRLDRRRLPAEARHARDRLCAWHRGRRDLDRFLRHPEGRAATVRPPMPSSITCWIPR